MKNYWQEVCTENPFIREYGITTFGQYSLKTPRIQLKREHHKSSYEICFLESGMQPYYVYPSMDTPESEGSLFRIYGGEIFITRPYEVHSSGPYRQLRGQLCWIQLDSECPSLFKHTEQKSNLLKKALASLDHHVLRTPRAISARLPEAYSLILNPTEENLFRACELLSLFIMELAEFNKGISDENYRYGTLSAKGLQAVTFIQENLLNPALDLDAVAAAMHYSRSYAMSAFKDEVGLTIHEFILRSKIDMACDILQTHTVTQTALLLNFSSSQHFSKVFQDHTGMTPTEYLSRGRMVEPEKTKPKKQRKKTDSDKAEEAGVQNEAVIKESKQKK
ncbi:MAG: helix-turn-helix transcriptional regulator [Clostridia bacterium]|nr:helix-turn-helix transcriptional regulator [Clostridia bacterium]